MTKSTDITINLNTPIKNIDDSMLSEIIIKEPTGAQLMQHGLPIKNGSDLDLAAGGRMLESLTGVQLPVLKCLSGKDFMRCVTGMMEHLNIEEEDVKK